MGMAAGGGLIPHQASQPSTLTTAATFFPVPEAISKKILNLEFVDMAELKPTAWLLHTESTDKAANPFKRSKEPVTDILVWIQCYSAM